MNIFPCDIYTHMPFVHMLKGPSHNVTQERETCTFKACCTDAERSCIAHMHVCNYCACPHWSI